MGSTILHRSHHSCSLTSSSTPSDDPCARDPAAGGQEVNVHMHIQYWVRFLALECLFAHGNNVSTVGRRLSQILAVSASQHPYPASGPRRHRTPSMGHQHRRRSFDGSPSDARGGRGWGATGPLAFQGAATPSGVASPLRTRALTRIR